MITAQTQLDLLNPQPGVYSDVPFSDYRKINAVNAHTLAWGSLSARHMKAALDGKMPDNDTPDRKWGRALHHRLLEPEEYKQRYVIAEPCSAILQSGKNKGKRCTSPGTRLIEGNWFCGSHGSGEEEPTFDTREVLSKEDSDAIELAAEAVRNHDAERLRKFKGHFEVTLIADLQGVRCKCRVDKLIERPATLIDPKKVTAPDRPSGRGGAAHWFVKQIADGYGMQAAFYCDIFKALFGVMPVWFWIVIEDGPPFCPAVYKASDITIAAGRNEYLSYLFMLKRCRETNEWPGYTTGAETIDGPNWWVKQFGGM